MEILSRWLTALTYQTFSVLIFYLPVALGVFWIFHRRMRWKKLNKAPFEDELPHPAGESTRLKTEDFRERATMNVVIAIVAPAILGLMHVFTQGGYDPLVFLIFLGVAYAVSAWALVRAYCLLKQAADYNLGFQGERFVGEELNKLIRHGYEVFHDLQFGKFNIDHVLAGPSGVYAIETKTRRKPVRDGNTENSKVTFDGHKLHYPWGSDLHGIEQSRRNAKTLSDWLSKTVGERVDAEPVLALPGWWVERRAAGDVVVISARNMDKIFLKSTPTPLSGSLVQRIAYQLDQKSRERIPEPSK